MRISANFRLLLFAILFGVVLVPASGWATTSKNCPVEPTQNEPIASGETFSGSNCILTTTGDVDSFTFKAVAGDTWSMVTGLGASPKSDICLTLYAPGSTGTPLFTGCTYNGGGIPSVATNQKLAAAGTYTIIVTELVDGTTPYSLSLERINPAPPDAAALTLAKNVAAEVNPPTAQDAYTFYGATTGTYEIVASYTSGAADICFNVYQAGVTVLTGGAPCTYAGGGITTIKANVTPKVNGTFVVVAYAATNDGNSNYDLEVTCFLGTCPLTPPKCSLTDAVSYNATTGTLTMNFTLYTPVAVTWRGFLVSSSGSTAMWSQAQAITPSAITVTKTQAQAKSGVVGVLSTLSTTTAGITCSSFTTIGTGKP